MNDKVQFVKELQYLKEHLPKVYDLVDVKRVENPEYITQLKSKGYSDFEAEESGGRGKAYNRAQIDPTVRGNGIRQLIKLLLPEKEISGKIILDVLGGDGVVARALKEIFPNKEIPYVITGDVAYQMVIAARRHKLPAILQPAEYLILKNESVDGVFLAYGTHHIDGSHRQPAVNEAFRVLKPGGRFVLHDFVETGPVARWFHDVVDKYSKTGHNYSHFSSEEMKELLTQAGFVNIEIRHVYDPFVFTGESDIQVREKLSQYLLSMYGLEKLREEYVDKAGMKVFELASSCFIYNFPTLNLPVDFGKATISVQKIHSKYQIEMPRVALVASGTKS